MFFNLLKKCAHENKDTIKISHQAQGGRYTQSIYLKIGQQNAPNIAFFENETEMNGSSEICTAVYKSASYFSVLHLFSPVSPSFAQQHMPKYPCSSDFHSPLFFSFIITYFSHPEAHLRLFVPMRAVNVLCEGKIHVYVVHTVHLSSDNVLPTIASDVLSAFIFKYAQMQF